MHTFKSSSEGSEFMQSSDCACGYGLVFTLLVAVIDVKQA